MAEIISPQFTLLENIEIPLSRHSKQSSIRRGFVETPCSPAVSSNGQSHEIHAARICSTRYERRKRRCFERPILNAMWERLQPLISRHAGEPASPHKVISYYCPLYVLRILRGTLQLRRLARRAHRHEGGRIVKAAQGTAETRAEAGPQGRVELRHGG